MAIKYFQWKAAAVAQVSTIQITAYDAATTYTLSVNGVPMCSVIAAGTADDTASDLADAWNLLATQYAATITASVATDTITFTADQAEAPFTIAPSVSGGTGTIGSLTTTTSPTGPHTLDDADNWDSETLPSNSDELVFRDSSEGVLWGLDQLATTGHILRWEDSALGSLGLDPSEFALNGDGSSVEDGLREYRGTYLELDCAEVHIGEHDGLASPGGSRRILIDNDRASASECTVYRANDNGLRTGRPAVYYKAAHASANIEVKAGSVGLGTLVPGETLTLGEITNLAGNVQVGPGVTLTTATHRSGALKLNLGTATLTTLAVDDGQVEVRGDQAITTANINGGESMLMSTGTITTVNHRGGLVDYTGTDAARTVTTHKIYANGGATLRWDDSEMTITVDWDSDAFEISAI